MSSGQVMLLGPGGSVTVLEGPRGTTPPCPEAKFKARDVCRVRRLKHLRNLPEICAIVAVIPPGFSPDWAWADVKGEPRPLMHQVGARTIKYIVAFEGDPSPHILRESCLLPTNEPPAEISFAPKQADAITAKQIELIRHALGLQDGRKVSYRNRFIAGSGHEDYADWLALTAAGYAERVVSSGYAGGADYFLATLKGAVAVLRRGEKLDREDFPEWTP